MSGHPTKIGLWTAALAMIAALLPVSMASGQSDGPPALITAAPGARTVMDTTTGVVRARAVDLDTDTLFLANGDARQARDLPRVRLEMFDDASFTGVITDVTTSGLGWSWIGDLEGIAGGYFYIAEADGTLAIHAASPAGIYEVRATADGGYKAVEIDQSAFADEPPGEYTPPVLDESAPADAQSRAVGDTIDVIVLYTPAARAAAGGTGAMKALIALAMTEANNSYERSGVDPRLRLLHVQEVPYTEAASGAFFTALDDQVYGTNGLDIAGTLRNTYGADMVSLIFNDPTYQYCGLAAGILPGAAYAYQVVDYRCATGYYSFGHEFGHLQGAHHDPYASRDNGDPNDVFTYGYGYVHLGTDYSSRWRTVMAYNDECDLSDGIPNNGPDCTRLNWWSNPTKNIWSAWGGDPVGVSDTKNYQVLNDTAVEVAGWRATVIGNDFFSKFTNNAKGWGVVKGNWSVDAGGRYISKGVANMNASVKRTAEFGNLTFSVKMKRKGDADQPNWIAIRGRAGKVNSSGLWRPAYYLMYRNDGTYSIIEIKKNGDVVTKVPWKNSAAINTGTSWNTLKIVANGNTLKFYINGTRVKKITDNSLDIGNVGFGFQDELKSGQKLLVDWAKLANSPTA